MQLGFVFDHCVTEGGEARRLTKFYAGKMLALDNNDFLNCSLEKKYIANKKERRDTHHSKF